MQRRARNDSCKHRKEFVVARVNLSYCYFVLPAAEKPEWKACFPFGWVYVYDVDVHVVYLRFFLASVCFLRASTASVHIRFSLPVDAFSRLCWWWLSRWHRDIQIKNKRSSRYGGESEKIMPVVDRWGCGVWKFTVKTIFECWRWKLYYSRVSSEIIYGSSSLGLAPRPQIKKLCNSYSIRQRRMKSRSRLFVKNGKKEKK